MIINSFQALNYFITVVIRIRGPPIFLKEQEKRSRTESRRFEIEVSPCNFPTVRARKAIYTRDGE